jgi:hypothetical protein
MQSDTIVRSGEVPFGLSGDWRSDLQDPAAYARQRPCERDVLLHASEPRRPRVKYPAGSIRRGWMGLARKEVVLTCIDYDLRAHWRRPMVMIRHG